MRDWHSPEPLASEGLSSLAYCFAWRILLPIDMISCPSMLSRVTSLKLLFDFTALSPVLQVVFPDDWPDIDLHFAQTKSYNIQA
jgi:hypothetical protein